MKRFFAILAFLSGGISAEIVHPLNCSLAAASQARVRRPKSRRDDGKR